MNTETPAPAAAPTPAPAATPAAAPPASPAPAATPPAATPPAARAPLVDPNPPAADPNKPAGEQPAFKVPDAYKEKPWASKIKSEDDLYKQLDNLDTAVGKKSIVPDFKNSTPEQIEEYLSKTRPENKDAYKFAEGAHVDPEFTGAIGDIMLKAGISEYQGNKVIEGYQALEKTKIEAAMSADGFKDTMKKSFGDQFDGVVTAVVAQHKAVLNKEDQTLMDTLPNEYLGLVYRLTQNMAQKYGAKETDIGANNPGGGVPGANLNDTRARLRAEIAAFDTKPHTADEKQAKINELNNTYKG